MNDHGAECTVIARRSMVGGPDQFDRHDAYLDIDGVRRGRVAAQQAAAFSATTGPHHLRLRLAYNWFVADVDVDLTPTSDTVVVFERTRRSVRGLFDRRRYWDTHILHQEARGQ